MINSTVYNECMTDDLKAAIRNKDESFFRKEIVRLTKILANRGNPKVGYDQVATRLMICLAQNDVLVNNGDTVKFICDTVNF